MTGILKVDTIQNSTGTDALSIDSNGVISSSQQPYGYWYHDASETPTTDNPLVNWTVVNAQGITESGGTWTIPYTGAYLITISLITLDTPYTGGVYVAVNNASVKYRIIYTNDSAALHNMNSGQIILNLNANDTFQFTNQNSIGWYGNSATDNTVGGVTVLKVA